MKLLKHLPSADAAVHIVGWDPGVPVSPELLRLGERRDDLASEGVLVLDVRGRRETWLIATDPCDGYRSFLNPLNLQDAPSGTLLQFRAAPLPVTISRPGSTPFGSTGDFVVFTGSCGHVWLTIGTAELDDYYPCSVAVWTPKVSS